MSAKSQKEITRDELYQLYRVQKLSVLAIARHFGCRNGTVIDKLKEFGLHKSIKREDLIQRYVEQELDIDAVAAALDCTEANVRYYLRKFDIPIRYKSTKWKHVARLHDRDWLYEQYISNGLSSYEIAELIGCYPSSVLEALHRHAIPTRSGRAVEERKPPVLFAQRTRLTILRRDNYVCQMPGCSSQENLETHHITPPTLGGSNTADNGITLCRPCHVLTIGKEMDFAEIFYNIIQRLEPSA